MQLHFILKYSEEEENQLSHLPLCIFLPQKLTFDVRATSALLINMSTLKFVHKSVITIYRLKLLLTWNKLEVTLNISPPLYEKCPNMEFFWSVFSRILIEYPVFWLNMKIYSVNIRIQSEYGKIGTRKNSAFGNFSHSPHYRSKLSVDIQDYRISSNSLMTEFLII